MTARRGLVPVFLGTVLVATAYASAFAPGGAPRWAFWAMSLGTAVLCPGMMALGAGRPARSLGPLRFALAFTFVVLLAGFGLAFGLPGPESGSSPPPLLAGLPVRAALILYGVGLLPALVLPLVYALTFERMTLDAADLERIRAARPPPVAPPPTQPGPEAPA